VTEVFEEDSAPWDGEGPASFQIRIDSYAGPIELLHELVKKRKLDIAAVSVLEVVDQFVDFVGAARDLQLDVRAEWLAFAAELVYLKSCHLMPPENADERQKAEASLEEKALMLRRQDLVLETAKFLAGRRRLGRDWFGRGGSTEFDGPRAVAGARSDQQSLFAACAADLRRAAPPAIPALEPYDLRQVDEAKERLERLFDRARGWLRFEDVLPPAFAEGRRRSEAASHFVAALELAKMGVLDFRQDQLFGPLWLRACEPDPAGEADAA
jgi:segregation and condensation protein A